MMIKRYGTIDISEWYIHISRETDTNTQPNSIPVYFDAAFSRKVVEQRVIIGGYTLIKEFMTEGVLVPELNHIILVYDPKTFHRENGYEEINKFLNNTNKELLVFKGTCECSYDPEHASITVAIQGKEKVNWFVYYIIET